MNIHCLSLPRILIHIVLLSFLTAFGFACRTVVPVATERKYYSGLEVYEKLSINDPDVKTYSAGRMNLTINDNGENINLRGAVRISKDSAIMVSINAFAGIEAARMLLTRDSIKIIDRINNMYFVGDYRDAKKFLPVTMDFDIVQSIFMGSVYSLVNDLNIFDREGTQYLLDNDVMAVRYTGEILPSEGNIPDNDMLQIKLDSKFRTRDIEFFSKNNSIYTRLKFNSFNNTGGLYLPDDVDIYYISDNIPLQANMRFSRIELNRDLNFPFNIPARFNPY